MALKKANQAYIPSLTGVRSIAAQMVFVCHFNLLIFNDAFIRFQREMHIGVTLFFVLSGFLITRQYYEKSNLTKSFWKPYLLARFARIYPIYILLTIVTYITVAPFDHFNFWTNLTLTKSFFNDYKMTPITQAWTLTVEECFYFTAPFIFYFIKTKKMWVPFLFIPFVAIVFIPNNNFSFLVYYTYIGRIFEFLVGVMLARYFINIETWRKTKTNFSFLTTAGALLILGTIYVLSILPFDPKIEEDLGVVAQLGVHSYPGMLINNIILPIFTAIFYAGLILEESLVDKILGSKFFILLGQSSYVFYLLQHFALSTNIRSGGPLNYFLITIGFWICSILIYKLFENPVRKYIVAKNPSL